MSTTAPVPSSRSQQHLRESMLTEEVLRSFAATPDTRIRDLLQSLVRHTHDFVRENCLTESEWEAAIDFLRRCGDITSDNRQEFILLSDVLGISMQTVNVNQTAVAGATEPTVFGPFFIEGAPRIELGGDIAQGAHGEPCWVQGKVTSTRGNPIAGARIEVWEADDEGFYDVQRDDHATAGRGHLYTDAAGRFRFWGITPTPYPIPHDGPVGEMLATTLRSPMRAAHLHFMVSAPGHRRLVTHIFVAEDELLATDAVFGVKQSLVLTFERHPIGTPTPDGRLISSTWSEVTFDIVLAGAAT